MKKRLTIISLLVLLTLPLLTACDKHETPHAFVSVVTSNGNYSSYLSSNYMDETEASTIWVVDNKEVTVSVLFSCPTCKYEEAWEASTVAPQSKLFSCECKGKNEEVGKTEYFAITVTSGEPFFGVKEKEMKK